MTLLVAPCTAQAARFATTNWHYSGTMPLGRTVKFGVWWDAQFRGVIVFARGSTPTLGRRLGLAHGEVVELARVALTDHPEFTVTAAVAAALRALHRSSPGLRAVVSFADPQQGHVGKIYQAGNWLYLGRSTPAREYLIDGKWTHSRTFSGRLGFAGAGSDRRRRSRDELRSMPTRLRPAKHRYVFPFDRQTRRRAERLAQPYPVG